jgi:S-adenosylmethionine-diacylgycerolhomoserine-N-methlytransferase
MKLPYLRKARTHRQTMTNYYGAQARIYDATRWMFLYGRQTLIDQIDIRPGDRVLEIGCGTGKNFEAIQCRLNGTGELIGVDCCAPMLDKAGERVLQNNWTNVRLIDLEYGKEPITRGKADVVLFSYSLSMIPDWNMALACAHSELWAGGLIGVVDFCKPANASKWFADWLAVNHVDAGQPYEEGLVKLFRPVRHLRYNAWAGLWSFYLFIGTRPTPNT